MTWKISNYSTGPGEVYNEPEVCVSTGGLISQRILRSSQECNSVFSNRHRSSNPQGPEPDRRTHSAPNSNLTRPPCMTAAAAQSHIILGAQGCNSQFSNRHRSSNPQGLEPDRRTHPAPNSNLTRPPCMAAVAAQAQAHIIFRARDGMVRHKFLRTSMIRSRIQISFDKRLSESISRRFCPTSKAVGYWERG